MRWRRGFALAELIVAMVLFLIVSGTVFSLLNHTQRVARAQAERVDIQGNLRAGALIIPAELRMLGYDSVPGSATVGSDIVAMGSDSIVVRAVRSSGIICQLASNTLTIDTAASRYYSATRLPVSGGRDQLMLFLELDPATTADDRWVSGRPITSVGPGVCSTAYGSRPGLRLGTLLGATGHADSLTIGAPFRTYEVMVYRLYQSGSTHYLGARSASAGEAALQPMLGPLTPNGFRLDYYDSTGTVPAARPADVRSIQVTLIGQSDQRVTGTGAGSPTVATDSVVTRVTLRNALR
ncbi:MAG TPA: prepilin-type N-terminal cleavage/methylation domain-containing protein [Gemmatimonadales bacterium]